MLFCTAGQCHSRRRVRKGLHPGLFYNFWQNIHTLHVFPWILGFAAAVIVTVVMVHSGADTAIQQHFQARNPLGPWLPWLMLSGGNFWHILIALGMLIRGKLRANTGLIGGSLAAGQALLLNALVNTTQKILSGRMGPDYMDPAMGTRETPFFSVTRDPGNFRFDFWNSPLMEGRFFWPSGHTASIFAFVAALAAYYPDKKWIPLAGYPFAALTGIAMIDGDFHWASDVVAGAILGILAGHITGAAFRKAYLKKPAATETQAAQKQGYSPRTVMMPADGPDQRAQQ